MSKKNLKKLYNFSILVIFLLLAWWIFSKFSILEEIKNINFLYLLPIIFLLLLAVYLNGVFLKIMAGVFKIDLKEHFLISTATSFFNLIIPLRGGLAMRAVFMKKKYGYAYSDFAASIFGNYVVLFLIASISAILLLTSVYFIYGIFNVWFIIVFCGLFVGMLGLIFLNISFKSKNFLIQKINKVMAGWRLIAGKRKVILRLSANTLLTFIVQAFVIQFTFLGLGLEISFIKALLMAVMNILVVFINITPGSLGLSESLYVISGTGLGISAGASLLAALVIRAINTLILVILGPIANYLLLKKL